MRRGGVRAGTPTDECARAVVSVCESAGASFVSGPRACVRACRRVGGGDGAVDGARVRDGSRPTDR